MHIFAFLANVDYKSRCVRKMNMLTYWFFKIFKKCQELTTLYIPATYEIISNSCCFIKIEKCEYFSRFLPEKSIKRQNKINVIIYLIVNKQSQCKFNKYIMWLENGIILTLKISFFEFLFFWNGHNGNKKPNMVPPFFILRLYSEYLKYRLYGIWSDLIRFLFPVFNIWIASVCS